jgi:hypothetical protein
MKFEILEKEVRGTLIEDVLLTLESGEFDALGIEAPCAIVALSKENLPRHAPRISVMAL